MQKVAILGGGIGSLATAAELTNCPGWQENYEITIYQMGWRLGGKGASGRNQALSDRIQEHGIHLWMGFYENAFQMIRQVYSEANQRDLMPTSPFTDARKAFSPMNFTPMMEQVGADWKLWNMNWTPSDEFPGEASTFEQKQQPPTPLGFVKLLLNSIASLLDEKREKHPILVSLYQEAVGHLCDIVSSTPVLPAPSQPLGAHTALHCVTAFLQTLPDDAALHSPAIHLQLAECIKNFNEKVFQLIAGQIDENDELRRFFIIVDTGLAAAAGMIEDRVLLDGFMAIEDDDMIDWLKKHGCK